MKYYIYVLKSLSQKRYYIGCTTDVKRREIEHNKGNTKSTRPFKPWRVIYTEAYETRSLAYKREWYLKHPRGYKEKLTIIKEYGEVPEWPNGAHC